MSYVTLALVFLAVAFGVGILLARKAPRTHWLGVGLTIVTLIILTAVFDSIMIATDLFYYDTDQLAGLYLGLAPIEDFSYPLACAVLLPGLWLALRRRPRAVGELRGLFGYAFAASRPVSWINTAFPFAAAMLMTTREIDWVLIVGTLYFLVPYNLAMYGINDVFDYESDLNNPRKGGIEGALLPPRLHKPMLWLVAITNVPFLAVLVGASGPAAWAALAVSVFALIAYSAPPFRFKERPVLDSLTSSVHFVSPAVVGLTMAGAEWDLPLVLVLLAFLLWGMAAQAYGAVQDVQPDREAGIDSIATVLGARRTVRIAICLWVISGLLMLATPWPGPLAAVIALPYVLNAAPWWTVTDETSGRVNPSWRRFIWLNYAAGFLVTMLLILTWQIT